MPLTDKELQKEKEARYLVATELFKQILLFITSPSMKKPEIKKEETPEEIKKRPENLARAILETCLSDKTWIRNEAYSQVMKQLTKNPGGEPRRKGWMLMDLFVHHFAPTDLNMECVVETFLMKHGAHEMRQQFHQRIFGGSVTQPIESWADLIKVLKEMKIPKTLGWEKAVVYSTGITKLRYCF